MSKTDREKLNTTISLLVNQLEYVSSEIQLDKYIKSATTSKSGYDPIKDKIRNNGDIMWQLSTSLINLLSARQLLDNSTDSTSEFLSRIQKGDRDER